MTLDASFGGTNLIENNPDNLTVSFNEAGSSSLTINGIDSSTVGLGVGPALVNFFAGCVH